MRGEEEEGVGKSSCVKKGLFNFIFRYHPKPNYWPGELRKGHSELNTRAYNLLVFKFWQSARAVSFRTVANNNNSVSVGD